MKLITLATATLSLFVGGLCAQSQTQTQTQRESQTTTTTSTNPVNLDGTLIDQNCYTSHSRSKETNSDQNSTTTTVTTKDSSDCPVTASTRSYGLLQPNGQVVRFDDASNAKVNQMIRSDNNFNSEMKEHRPVRVRVVAMPNGDVMVIKDIKADRQ